MRYRLNAWGSTPAARAALPVALALAAGALTACQTTTPTPTRTLEFKDTEVTRTKFILPPQWLDKVQAQYSETGSLRYEQITFDEGFIRFSQFFRGGFRASTDDSLVKSAQFFVNTKTLMNAPQHTQMPLGDIRYVTLEVPQKEYCLYFVSDQGLSVRLKGGAGTEAKLEGLYCLEANASAEATESEALAFLEQLRIDD